MLPTVESCQLLGGNWLAVVWASVRYYVSNSCLLSGQLLGIMWKICGSCLGNFGVFCGQLLAVVWATAGYYIVKCWLLYGQLWDIMLLNVGCCVGNCKILCGQLLPVVWATVLAVVWATFLVVWKVKAVICGTVG